MPDGLWLGQSMVLIPFPAIQDHVVAESEFDEAPRPVITEIFKATAEAKMEAAARFFSEAHATAKGNQQPRLYGVFSSDTWEFTSLFFFDCSSSIFLGGFFEVGSISMAHLYRTDDGIYLRWVTMLNICWRTRSSFCFLRIITFCCLTQVQYASLAV